MSELYAASVIICNYPLSKLSTHYVHIQSAERFATVDACVLQRGSDD
jgi:hypothetical protein